MEMAFRTTVGEARERGRTVFLSSHILSEVEALCDRVGILRGGRLVDEGTLADLRHLGARSVELTFADAPPQLDGIPGVTVVATGPRTVSCEVNGTMQPLLAALAGHAVTELTSREPSLEEIFLHHYDGTAAPAAVGAGQRRGGDRRCRPLARVALRTLRDTRVRDGAFAASSRAGADPAARLPATLFLTVADRAAFASSFGDNAAIRLFYGTPHELLTAGGYTAWRVGGFLAILPPAPGARSRRSARAPRRTAWTPGAGAGPASSAAAPASGAALAAVAGGAALLGPRSRSA